MWIDIKDKVPKPFQRVIVFPFDKNYHSVDTGLYDEYLEEFYTALDGQKIDVDYWMPLPNPPKEETIQEKVERSIQNNAHIWKELAGK